MVTPTERGKTGPSEVENNWGRAKGQVNAREGISRKGTKEKNYLEIQYLGKGCQETDKQHEVASPV